jgi:succinate dehydrogenase/fumarate reductase-like Fe-S protein
MLLQTLPGTDALSFDDVVPKTPKASSTETRRVAAAAFYHCLGKCFACLSDCVVMAYEGFPKFFQPKTWSDWNRKSRMGELRL